MTSDRLRADASDEDLLLDEPIRVAVVTGNRTAGAVVRAMLQGPGRAVEWLARDQVMEGRATVDLGADLVFFELSEPADVQWISTRAGAEGAPACVAMTAPARGDLRAGAEAAGFQGWVGLPAEAGALADVARSLCERLGRRWDGKDEAPGDGTESAIDRRALEDLAGLGGDEFLQDIVTQFLEDAGSLLHALHAAMKAGDVAAFRDQAHALRSCAANVGARAVYAKCLDMRGIEARELAQMGEAHMQRLEVEVQQARQALAAYGKG